MSKHSRIISEIRMLIKQIDANKSMGDGCKALAIERLHGAIEWIQRDGKEQA